MLWIEFSLLALPPLSQCVSIYAVYICGLHMWWPSLKLHGIRVTHSARNFANCPLTTRTLCQKTNLARPVFTGAFAIFYVGLPISRSNSFKPQQAAAGCTVGHDVGRCFNGRTFLDHLKAGLKQINFDHCVWNYLM